MMILIKRIFMRIFRSLISMYGPALLTLAFAVVFFQFFPDGPIWPVPIFCIFVIVVFYRYVKW
ncbi:hypothetical protein [Enterobacter chuandaensis]|uniref:Uncharacterized protein n=1 Tax=Enterobacter chuandaensis TaxID=2497875 RepID=A0AA96M5Z8_9ENTR|nr:hypothetical protein [Enterobacter chuandaensis]OQD48855.1 hypothetical protein BWZ29_14555 [Enterobacter cancerogenus]MCW4780654.1 hypothetical protein [Enterobacter chuandaensis]MDA4758503.1 hypothetical protein [Enterobacter chuandaensis]RJL02787.1 hypothetical protein D5066_08720 [Enterobacter chuandaensis]WNS40279.1 hypothetical protein RQP59_12545 [Enterobacter chuandaensis]